MAMKFRTVFFFLFFIHGITFAQNQQEIHAAFERGDVDGLAAFFDSSIDMTVLQSEGIYSKTQARVILRNFFAENSPGTFTMQHQGGNDNAKYIVGTLQVQNAVYRVYYLSKISNNTMTIQKLRIEHDR